MKLHTCIVSLAGLLIGLCHALPQAVDPSPREDSAEQAAEPQNLPSDAPQPEDDFFATALTGFEGCGGLFNPEKKNKIRQGWRDAWPIQNVVANGADWNDAATLEFLGSASSLTSYYQGVINDILKQVATLQPGYIGTPFDWPLHVRCDDPKQKCPCGTTSPTLAYTVNTADGDAYINFCQRYFDAPTLSDKISEMKNAPDYEKFDIDSYRITKGAIWYHELTHWDRGAQRNDFTHVTDYTIQYLEKTRGGNTWTRVTRPVYGGLPTKILAKWNLSPGQYVSTSADNLALYAVAKYVQKQIGRYPDLPVLPLSTRPEGDPTRGTALVSQGDNGVVQISVGDDVLLPDGVDCGVEQTEVLKVDSFFDQSSYPADYVANHEKRVAELMGGGGGDVGASCEGKAKASDCRNLDWGSGSLDVAIDLSQSGNGQTCYQDGNARWCDVVTAGSCQATVLWDGTANGGSLPAVTRQELKAWVDAHVGSDSCTAASEKVSGICALKPGPALCTTEKTLCVKGYGYGCP